MFQQRHFEAIAQMMQELKPHWTTEGEVSTEERMGEVAQWHKTRDALSALFARHNDRFQLGRFERACQPGANVRARKAA